MIYCYLNFTNGIVKFNQQNVVVQFELLGPKDRKLVAPSVRTGKPRP